ncbi:unnamed protein product [Symbiodinium natans]|uniref:PARP catalytic domain-containing protein n=1 Tax=Symbiodinium natans TaxID=878477 RepID=A0A812GXI9_9DINO|nr:unnamed protein product [Symbiodinium natans]
MACAFDEQWELAPAPRHKKKLLRHVRHSWLREPVPHPDDLSESKKALKVVADASLEECLDEMLSERQDATSSLTSSRKLDKQWSSLLSTARRKVQGSIETEFGPETKLEPLHPDPQVKEDFFFARKCFSHTTTFTYHGTKSRNIASISRVGLLMPGTNGHKVANGSAHGVGIYTAQLGSATLSKGFCDSNKMFVCAVCDSSQPVDEPEVTLDTQWKPSGTIVQTIFPKGPAAVNVHPSVKRLGRHNVQRRSDQVLHVGDAVVTFQQGCVVPLFLLAWPSEKEWQEEDATLPQPAVPDQLVLKHHAWDLFEQPWELPQQVGRRRLAVPETDATRLIKFGNEYDCKHPRRGRTVWLVSDPFQGRTSSEKWVKRRFIERQQCVAMKRRQRWKDDHLGKFGGAPWVQGHGFRF